MMLQALAPHSLLPPRSSMLLQLHWMPLQVSSLEECMIQPIPTRMDTHLVLLCVTHAGMQVAQCCSMLLLLHRG
jgi:hypothetical protein